MIKICAWCKKEMGITPSSIKLENAITHGICKKCANSFNKEKDTQMKGKNYGTKMCQM